LNAVQTAPSPLKAWMLATRPATLPAGAVPVVVATALASADGVFAAGPALAALAAAILVQIGTNLANDYYDFKKGADNEDRLGPARATQKGWLTPGQVMAGAVVVSALAGAAGLYLTWVAGWPALAIGVVSIACAFLYTGGPSSASWRWRAPTMCRRWG
jgi:1,4-dihydroxy-2-naphthoate octaprenyltransferase